MNADEYRVATAWSVASSDLGIRVTSPFVLAESGERTVEYIALIHCFGSPNGTLINLIDDAMSETMKLATARGFFASTLNPYSYATYQREHFIDTLKDWGWYGAEQKPAWL